MSSIFGVLFVICCTLSRGCFSFQPPDDFPDVQTHYNTYPYPPVDLERENIRDPPLARGPSLGEINHFLHGGKLRKDRPYRIWVVGGGTGNSSLHYAHEFRHFQNVEIVHMDVSNVALEIARKRAKRRNFKIKFVHESIYKSPKLDLGKFDFIDCVEVFHQLPDLDLALKILKESLKEKSSGIYLSLHGTEGRKGINLMRKIISFVNEDKGDISFEEELTMGLALYDSLPKHHWVYFPHINKISPPDNSSFYNKYIHKHEASFTVNEAYDFIEKKGGLHLVDFADPNARVILNTDPRNDPEFTELMADLTLEQRRDIHERIYSALSEINIFVSGDPKASVNPEDSSTNIPFFYNIDPSPILKTLSVQECGVDKIKQFINISLVLESGDAQHWRNVIHPVNEHTLTFYELIALRKHSVDAILDKTVVQSSIKDRATLRDELMTLLGTLLKHGLILYRDASVPDEPSFNRVPNGDIEHINMIHVELSIYASQWPHWTPMDVTSWPDKIIPQLSK